MNREVDSIGKGWLPAALLALLLLIPAAGCRSGGEGEATGRPVAVRAQRPVRTNLEVKTSYLGTVRRGKEIRVTARIPGTVEELPWREGDEVPEGARIALLSASELEAAAERLRVESDYWRRRHEADVRLADAGALPRDRAEESERASRSAAAALAEADARLEKREEVAPMRATILDHFVEPGDHVLPGQALLLLGGGGVEIHAEVVDGDLSEGIGEGTPVVIYPVGGDTIASEVSEVAPISTDRSRSFTVKARVPAGREGTMRAGSSVRIDFLLASARDRLAIPVEAIRRSADGDFLFLVRGGVAVHTPVNVGIVSGGLAEVSFDWDGVAPVAVSNLESVRDGIALFAVLEESPEP